jgi:hypothetical protein
VAEHFLRASSFLGTFVQSRKACVCFVPVRLSARIAAIPTERISTKFDIMDFNENLLSHSKFCCIRAEVSGTLLDDRSTFYCCWRHNFAIEILLWNTEYFYITESDTGLIFAFRLQQWLRERVTMLRYAFITYLVLYKCCTRIYISHEHFTLACWHVLENVRCLY